MYSGAYACTKGINAEVPYAEIYKSGFPKAGLYPQAKEGKIMEMRIIAKVYTDFPTKFGVPRQSRLVSGLPATLVFEPEFRNADALSGLSGYSHIWLIWEFSKNLRADWSATVRPPRLGRNRHMGVFASRSPFRPNPIGLSCVKLLEIRQDPAKGPVLVIDGADMVDGTPVFDIKPYNPYSDSVPDATTAFVKKSYGLTLKVEFPGKLQENFPEEKREALIRILEEDPRPAYEKKDPKRVYVLPFAGYEVSFYVEDELLTVCKIAPDH